MTIKSYERYSIFYFENENDYREHYGKFCEQYFGKFIFFPANIEKLNCLKPHDRVDWVVYSKREEKEKLKEIVEEKKCLHIDELAKKFGENSLGNRGRIITLQRFLAVAAIAIISLLTWQVVVLKEHIRNTDRNGIFNISSEDKKKLADKIGDIIKFLDKYKEKDPRIEEVKLILKNVVYNEEEKIKNIEGFLAEHKDIQPDIYNRLMDLIAFFGVMKSEDE